MATSTLANPPNSHRLLAQIVRPLPPLSYPQRQPEFRVFPTATAEYHWRIAALATNRTISCHKSLSLTLRKCTRLNDRRSEGARNETN